MKTILDKIEENAKVNSNRIIYCVDGYSQDNRENQEMTWGRGWEKSGKLVLIVK